MASEGKLPNGLSRTRELVRRSAPKRDRPRLPEEYENQLHDIDREMAATYASMEDLEDRLDRCIDNLDDEGVVMRAISQDDSLAVQIEDLSDEAEAVASEHMAVVVAVGEDR